VPVSKAQMTYVHIMGHTTFVSLQFLKNRFCGHSTFVLSTINYCMTPISCNNQHWHRDCWEATGLVLWRLELCVTLKVLESVKSLAVWRMAGSNCVDTTTSLWTKPFTFAHAPQKPTRAAEPGDSDYHYPATTRWCISTGPPSFKRHNIVNIWFIYIKICLAFVQVKEIPMLEWDIGENGI